MSFINEKQIFDSLERNAKSSESELTAILSKALLLKGLTLDETAALLNCREVAFTEKLFSTARTVKEKIYGNRLVFFAPLYLSNECINNCLYCAFRKDNTLLERKPCQWKKSAARLRHLNLRVTSAFFLLQGNTQNPRTWNMSQRQFALFTLQKSKNQWRNPPRQYQRSAAFC